MNAVSVLLLGVVIAAGTTPAVAAARGGRGTQAIVAPGQDSVFQAYQRARQALNQGEYERAAGLFRSLRVQFPGSRFSAESFYYEAVTLERLGTGPALAGALHALETLRAQHPAAPVLSEAMLLEWRVRSRNDATGSGGRAESSPPADVDLLARCMGHNFRELSGILLAQLPRQPDDGLELLRSILTQQPRCMVPLREQAVLHLGRIARPTAHQLLAETVRRDPHSAIRSRALSTLVTLPAQDIMLALYPDLETPIEREAIINAVGRVANGAGLAWLEQRAADLREHVVLRGQAIRWISQAPDGVPHLTRLLQVMERGSLREQVGKALEQRSTNTPFPHSETFQ